MIWKCVITKSSFLLVALSCASQTLVHQGPTTDCESVIKGAEQAYTKQLAYQKSRALITSTAAGAVTGAVATLEAATYLSGGMLTSLVVCPIAASFSDAFGSNSVKCLGRMAGALAEVIFTGDSNLPIARSTWNSTQSLREENYDLVSKLYREGISCYLSRRLPGDIPSAHVYLMDLMDSEGIYSNVSVEEKKQIQLLDASF